MEQWVVKICEMGNAERKENAELSKVSVAVPLEANVPKVNVRIGSNRVEEHQNVGCSSVNKAKSESAASFTGTDKETTDSLSKNHLSPVSSSAAAAVLDVASATATSSAASGSTPTPASAPAPSLPARIPRRLPSLPTAAYVSQEEEEDDMYYRIEDFRDTTHCYNNVLIGKANRIPESTLNGPGGNQVRSDVKDPSIPIEKSKRNSDNPERPTGSQSGTNNNDSDNSGSAASTLNNDSVDQGDKYYDDVEVMLILFNSRSRVTRCQLF